MRCWPSTAKSRPRDGSPPDPDSLEASIGPIIDRPDRDELRTQILLALAPPQRLSIAADGADVLIGADSRSPRRLSPGVPHARVDSEGTARIRCSLEPGKLTVSERYDRRRRVQRDLRRAAHATARWW